MEEKTDLSMEALTSYDLVDAVVQNIKRAGEGKIVMPMNCHKVWESLISNKLKAS